MKIYLAGKINGVPDWRAEIVDKRQWGEKSYSYGSWKVQRAGVFAVHDYTGPYWTSHHNDGTVHTDNNAEWREGTDCEDNENAILLNCFMAVCDSDLLFARYTDDHLDASHGTIAEVAWAFHKRIPVVGYGDLDAPWFVRRMCSVWYDRMRGSEADALRSYLKLVNYRAYIDSSRWKTFAASVKEERGNRCQVCNKGARLDAHHRTYERLGWEDPSDITVLCRDCHELYEVNKRALSSGGHA